MTFEFGTRSGVSRVCWEVNFWIKGKGLLSSESWDSTETIQGNKATKKATRAYSSLPRLNYVQRAALKVKLLICPALPQSWSSTVGVLRLDGSSPHCAAAGTAGAGTAARRRPVRELPPPEPLTEESPSGGQGPVPGPRQALCGALCGALSVALGAQRAAARGPWRRRPPG